MSQFRELPAGMKLRKRQKTEENNATNQSETIQQNDIEYHELNIDDLNG